MAKFDADMRSLVRRTILCFAATINGDGSPNLSPKSTLIVHDDDHLLFSNIASPRTVADLRLDPRIEINCVDIFLAAAIDLPAMPASARPATLCTMSSQPRCVPSMAMPSRSTMPCCQGAFCQTNSFTRLHLCSGRDGN